MPNILIRDVDAVVLDNMQLAAKQRGVSVNRLVTETLTEKFSGPSLPTYHDLDSLAGTWSEKDLAEFENAIAPLEKVDRELWAPKGRRKK